MNRGSCHSIPQDRIPERVVTQIVNMSGDTHKSGGEDSQSPAASCERTGGEDRGEAVRDHQEHREEKESDRPSEDQSGEQARENSIQIDHI